MVSNQDYLAWQAESGPAGKNKAYASLSRGWALGSNEFKTALVKDHALARMRERGKPPVQRKYARWQWQMALVRGLQAVRRSQSESIPAAKWEGWKLAVAEWMKTTTQVTNGWLREKLHMGAPAALSRNLTHYRRSQRDRDPLWKRLISKSAT